MPKERPILFSGPMVRAILEGMKTQTRRVVKPQPTKSQNGKWTEWRHKGVLVTDQNVAWRPFETGFPSAIASFEGGDLARICPYGAPGDRLWVKETFRVDDYDPARTIYVADVPEDVIADTKGIIKSRPSIHMPRSRSRITLEIESIRVERLNDISEEDAKAEGCAPAWLATDGKSVHAHARPTFRQGYARLWNEINGPGSWALNPWVRVIQFRRIIP